MRLSAVEKYTAINEPLTICASGYHWLGFAQMIAEGAELDAA
jgi:hypothetical protein